MPFDIQHRTVIRYATASPSDFAQLGEDIAARARALFTTEKAIRRLVDDPIAPQEGATRPEVIVLAVAAANMPPGDSAPIDQVRKDAERSSLTRAGFHVAVRRLMVKRYMTLEEVEREDSNDSWIERHVKLTDDGWDWINANESLFSFIKHDEDGANESIDVVAEDDIPFLAARGESPHSGIDTAALTHDGASSVRWRPLYGRPTPNCTTIVEIFPVGATLA